jgi:GNAT superfamily N-acetyltransferase
MSNYVETYKFIYNGKYDKTPIFPKEDLYIATENDRSDLESIDFFEDGEINAFLKDSSIYILRINGEYIGLGTVLVPTWRDDITDENIRDIGMHVTKKYRGQGYGRSIVQNLAELCLDRGYIPIAECEIENRESRLTLESAGFIVLKTNV